MTRRPPILLADSISAEHVSHIEPDTRVLLHYDMFSREALTDILAIESISGWVVETDYRPTGSLILSGTDHRGEKRTMPVTPLNVRIPRPSVKSEIATPPANRHPLCDKGRALAARIRGLHPDIGSAFSELFAALAPLETMANELASEAWEDELRRTEAIRAGDSVVAMIDTTLKPMRVPGGSHQ
jgi:hypothetical protein